MEDKIRVKPSLTAEEWQRKLENLGQPVGQMVRQARKELGLSQAELAERVSDVLPESWRQTTVAKVEAGSRPLRLTEALALSRALKLPSVEGLIGTMDLSTDLRISSAMETRTMVSEHYENLQMTLPELGYFTRALVTTMAIRMMQDSEVGPWSGDQIRRWNEAMGLMRTADGGPAIEVHGVYESMDEDHGEHPETR